MRSLTLDRTRPWQHEWLGNSVQAWVIAAVGAAIGFLIVQVIVSAARRVVTPRAERTNRTALRSLAAALDAVLSWLIALIAIVVALRALELSPGADYWLGLLTFLLIGYQLVRCVNRAIVTWLLRSAVRDDRTEVPVMLSIVTWACQFVVWITFLLALLSNAGVHITAFIASLGVGGIAVALAVQNILGDLLASVSIGLDKPFEPGEFIAFDADLGTVKHVGIKSTRIASLSGEELSISNSQLLSKLVHNYSRMAERRVVFGFTVPYDATGDQLREIADRTNATIQAAEPIRFDRGHFATFGDAGFSFEFVYYVLDPSYTLYMDIQQRINHDIIGILDSVGTRFAVPPREITGGAQVRG